jgi:hypothetical protein
LRSSSEEGSADSDDRRAELERAPEGEVDIVVFPELVPGFDIGDGYDRAAILSS